MSWFRRKPKPVNGTIVVDASKDHRCRPPGCHEWPAHAWKIDATKRYPEGTIWRCDCGAYWMSTAYGRGGGLWLTWESYWRNKHRDIERLEASGGTE